jgi:hypothetical protein
MEKDREKLRYQREKQVLYKGKVSKGKQESSLIN